jgi:hypothetical protein
MRFMIRVAQDLLPQTLLSYVAFRVAFRDTFDRYALLQRFDRQHDECYGYLCEVPFLREVPPHVQLDLLASVWRRHVHRETYVADLVDEAVIYAVCETTATIIEKHPLLITEGLRGGPIDAALPIDHFLATEIRGLYLNLSNQGDFLLISQFLDLDPEQGNPLKREMGLHAADEQALFDALSQWHVSPRFAHHLPGLLTEAEIARVANLLRVPCPA